MAWNPFSSSAEPLWPEALGEPSGESAERHFLVLEAGEEDRHDRRRRALECALLQRGLEASEHHPQRWAATLRVAFLEPLSEGRELLILAGHRSHELGEGLRYEAALPLEEGADAAAQLMAKRGDRLFHIGQPRRWTQLVRAEDEQIAEATAAMDAADPARRAAGAASLARLELFDRGPWVEQAVVNWEQAGYAADLSFSTLCRHELKWLQLARDPIAEQVLALIWALSDNNWAVEAIARRCGPRPELGIPSQNLAELVPSQMAAAACGVPVRDRPGWKGAASFEAMLLAQEEPRMQAVVALKAVQSLLPRYASGWSPARLVELRQLAAQATEQFTAEAHPKMRSLSLASLADVDEAAGEHETAESLRREALQILRGPDGRWRDEGLAKRLKALLS